MTTPDLKPCPFCGGEAVYDFHAKGMPEAWENDCDHWVYCDAEDCFANVGLCESKSEAIAAWNTRAPMDGADPAAIRCECGMSMPCMADPCKHPLIQKEPTDDRA